MHLDTMISAICTLNKNHYWFIFIEAQILEEPEGEEVTDEPAAETEDESAQTPGFTAIFAVALIAGAALIMRKD
ncbi:PGF-CTERM sorting domain-containing protein [Methanohalophilus portucalensis]|uniref:PGF-CTERM sorting domain-containing protein n=1 Tax=Methanohalophilus portucalensis TaxID=39664 RepID=UPI00117FCDDE|nr:PGF-CTERM sorting domain-containing protein [Methanohalophilus portucalensis]